MSDHPMLNREIQAKETCQEACPLIQCFAGFLLLCMANLALAQTPGATRCASDDNTGPEMVVLPSGSFEMGSPIEESGRAEDEGPQHTVEITSFALAVCEVTVAEFRRFVLATGYRTETEESGVGCWHNSEVGVDDWEDRAQFNWQNALHGGNEDNHPVVCVNWNDANAYAEWISELAGSEYRLPTEAEWEYAARAGSVQARYFGDGIQCGYVNGADHTTKKVYSGFKAVKCDDNYIHTAPVASFASNNWGLHDMLGNVWEWTQDCSHEDYAEAPADGSAWLEDHGGDCDRRVLRGGAWDDKPSYLRSANRSRSSYDDAELFVGFRLARTISPSAL